MVLEAAAPVKATIEDVADALEVADASPPAPEESAELVAYAVSAEEVSESPDGDDGDEPEAAMVLVCSWGEPSASVVVYMPPAGVMTC